MRAQAAAGDAPGALRYARTYEALVRSELGVAPDAEVAAFVARVQSGAPVAPAVLATAPSPLAAAPSLEPTVVSGARSRPKRVRPTAALGAFAIVAALLTGVWTLRRLRAESVRDTTPMRSTIALPDSAHLAARGRALAISPDGRRVVYLAGPVDSTRLYVRELDRLVATLMPGTEGAQQPFFSPDGEWIGFFAGRDLKKVPANGGPVVTLATLHLPGRGAWAQDGRILVSELEYGSRLSWVPGTGGATRPLALQPTSPAGDMELVDGDRWILHSSTDITRTDEITLSSLETGRSYAVTTDGLVDRDSVDVTSVIRGSNPRYLRSGHIMYVSGDGTPMALPFDLSQRRVVGTPKPLPDSISVDTYGASFAISRGGTLVYAPGANGLRTRLVWLDGASGRVDTLPFKAAAYRNPRLSPNGRRLAVGTHSPLGVRELFVLDLDRGTQMLVQTGIAGGVDGAGWSPDGSSLMFGGARQSLTDPSDREPFKRPGLRSPDGRHVVILMTGRAVQRDTTRGLVFASIDGSTPDDTIKGQFAFPQFSSDGALISYVDRSSGESEIYVARVVKPRERIKITLHGGGNARWAGARTLTYRLREDWFSVDISTASGLRATGSRRVFGGPYAAPEGWSYDVARDGKKFLLMLGPPKGTMNQLVVVTNWFAEVRKLAPAR
jgi:serine/threonine-protein kinase